MAMSKVLPAPNDANACSHRFVFELASRFGGANPAGLVGTNNPYDVVLPDEGSTEIRLSYNGAVHITNNVRVWKLGEVGSIREAKLKRRSPPCGIAAHKGIIR
jgi:hypothetical protein